MSEKISFQFLSMKAEATGPNSFRIIAYLCTLGLITALGMCALIVLI